MTTPARKAARAISSANRYAVSRLCTSRQTPRSTCTKKIKALITGNRPRKLSHTTAWVNRFVNPMVRLVEKRCRRESRTPQKREACAIRHVAGSRILLKSVYYVRTGKSVRHTFPWHLRYGAKVLTGNFPLMVINGKIMSYTTSTWTTTCPTSTTTRTTTRSTTTRRCATSSTTRRCPTSSTTRTTPRSSTTRTRK